MLERFSSDYGLAEKGLSAKVKVTRQAVTVSFFRDSEHGLTTQFRGWNANVGDNTQRRSVLRRLLQEAPGEGRAHAQRGRRDRTRLQPRVRSLRLRHAKPGGWKDLLLTREFEYNAN